MLQYSNITRATVFKAPLDCGGLVSQAGLLLPRLLHSLQFALSLGRGGSFFSVDGKVPLPLLETTNPATRGASFFVYSSAPLFSRQHQDLAQLPFKLLPLFDSGPVYNKGKLILPPALISHVDRRL